MAHLKKQIELLNRQLSSRLNENKNTGLERFKTLATKLYELGEKALECYDAMSIEEKEAFVKLYKLADIAHDTLRSNEDRENASDMLESLLAQEEIILNKKLQEIKEAQEASSVKESKPKSLDLNALMDRMALFEENKSFCSIQYVMNKNRLKSLGVMDDATSFYTAIQEYAEDLSESMDGSQITTPEELSKTLGELDFANNVLALASSMLSSRDGEIYARYANILTNAINIIETKKNTEPKM